MTPDYRDRFDGAMVHDLFDYDAELRHYHEGLRTAIGVGRGGGGHADAAGRLRAGSIARKMASRCWCRVEG